MKNIIIHSCCLLLIGLSCFVYSGQRIEGISLEGNPAERKSDVLVYPISSDSRYASVTLSRSVFKLSKVIKLKLYNSNLDQSLMEISVRVVKKKFREGSSSFFWSVSKVRVERELKFFPSVMSGNPEDQATKLHFESEPDVGDSSGELSDSESSALDMVIHIHWDGQLFYIKFEMGGDDAELVDLMPILADRGIDINYAPYLTKIELDSHNDMQSVEVFQDSTPAESQQSNGWSFTLFPSANKGQLGFYQPPTGDNIFDVVRHKVRQAHNDNLTPVFIYTPFIDRDSIPDDLREYGSVKNWQTTSSDIDSLFDTNDAIEQGVVPPDNYNLVINSFNEMVPHYDYSLSRIDRSIVFSAIGSKVYHAIHASQNANRYAGINHESFKLCSYKSKSDSTPECIGFAFEHTTLDTRVIVIAMNEGGEMKAYWSASSGYTMNIKSHMDNVKYRRGYDVPVNGINSSWCFNVRTSYWARPN